VPKGQGAITGIIADASQIWNQGPLYIYAAPYTGTETSPGFFYLEPNLHPWSEIQAGGSFQLNKVPPGYYVLLVGPEPEHARTVNDEKDEPRIVHVLPENVLELGSVKLTP
jgi:hypothetical protein